MLVWSFSFPCSIFTLRSLGDRWADGVVQRLQWSQGSPMQLTPPRVTLWGMQLGDEGQAEVPLQPVPSWHAEGSRAWGMVQQTCTNPREETYFCALVRPGGAERNHKAILISAQLGGPYPTRPTSHVRHPRALALGRGPDSEGVVSALRDASSLCFLSPTGPSQQMQLPSALQSRCMPACTKLPALEMAFSPENCAHTFPEGETEAQRGQRRCLLASYQDLKLHCHSASGTLGLGTAPCAGMGFVLTPSLRPFCS